jgi:antitoxin (DNA-binding transcriptional repressor) of toxin-antitoxin stability system
MNYITTTQLRTQSSDLIANLMAGKSIQLIHRSKIVATISPTINKQPKKFNAERFGKLLDELNLPKTTHAQREKIYRKHLMDKYGQGLS